MHARKLDAITTHEPHANKNKSWHDSLESFELGADVRRRDVGSRKPNVTGLHPHRETTVFTHHRLDRFTGDQVVDARAF